MNEIEKIKPQLIQSDVAYIDSSATTGENPMLPILKGMLRRWYIIILVFLGCARDLVWQKTNLHVGGSYSCGTDIDQPDYRREGLGGYIELSDVHEYPGGSSQTGPCASKRSR